MYTILVAVLVLCTVTHVPARPPREWRARTVLPASLEASDRRTAEHVYTATVHVGTPAEKMVLEVRFDIADLWLFRDQTVHSGTFHLESMTDVVYYGGSRRRDLVHDYRDRLPIPSSDLRCRHCDGVLGLHGDSQLWQWFPIASFTPASITLGGAPRAMHLPHHAGCDPFRTWYVPCIGVGDATYDDTVCTVRVTWRGSAYRARIIPNAPHISLPPAVYHAYILESGKSAYDTSNANWDPLEIQLVDSQHKACGADATGSEPLSLSFGRDLLTGNHGNEARELLADPDYEHNDTFTLGAALLSKVLLHRSANRKFLFLHEQQLHEELPVANAIFFTLVFIVLLRFKLTLIGRHYLLPATDLGAEASLNAAYRIAAWIFGLVALLLPVTFDTLADEPVLFWVSVGIIAVGVSVDAILWVAVTKSPPHLKSISNPSVSYAALLVRIWHEAVLLTALWLFAAPRRKEGPASIIVLVVAAVSLYSIAQYVFFSVVLFVVRPRPIFGTALLLTELVLIAWYGALFFFFFGEPLILAAAGIYSELTQATLVALGILLVLLGFIAGDLYINAAIKTLAQQRKAVLDQEEKLGNGGNGKSD